MQTLLYMLLIGGNHENISNTIALWWERRRLAGIQGRIIKGAAATAALPGRSGVPRSYISTGHRGRLAKQIALPVLNAQAADCLQFLGAFDPFRNDLSPHAAPEQQNPF